LKRARREQRSPPPPPGSRSYGKVLWIALAALVVLAAVLAIVIGRGGDDAPEGIPEAVPEAVPVEVEGASLPGFEDAASDPAVGRPAPGLAGTSATGGRLTIPSGAGDARVLVFLAHWCPHCQNELPLLVDWLQDGGLPPGVELYGVTTGDDPDRPNYPAVPWLEREGWQQPTLLDDESGAAAQAFGLTAYPFFVFVGADGRVVERQTGELPIDDLSARVEALADSAASRP
jgi:thiol-disulfide isomerase/thioredoxin